MIRKHFMVVFLALSCTILLKSPLYAGKQEEQETVVLETVGPSGEKPVSYREIKLTPGDVERVKKRNYTAAILMHTTSDFSNALTAGVRSVFEELKIKVLVTTDAEMDPNKQRTDVETALAMNPDIIITLVIDPVSSVIER